MDMKIEKRANYCISMFFVVYFASYTLMPKHIMPINPPILFIYN